MVFAPNVLACKETRAHTNETQRANGKREPQIGFRRRRRCVNMTDTTHSVLPHLFMQLLGTHVAPSANKSRANAINPLIANADEN